MKAEHPIGNYTSRAGVVRVRNALNPLLWTTAVVFPTSLLAAYFFRDDALLKYLLTAIGTTPVLLTLVAYFIYMFRDPDRLQSEEYLIRQQELEILYNRGDHPEIEEVPRDDLDLRIEDKGEKLQ